MQNDGFLSPPNCLRLNCAEQHKLMAVCSHWDCSGWAVPTGECCAYPMSVTVLTVIALEFYPGAANGRKWWCSSTGAPSFILLQCFLAELLAEMSLALSHFVCMCFVSIKHIMVPPELSTIVCFTEEAIRVSASPNLEEALGAPGSSEGCPSGAHSKSWVKLSWSCSGETVNACVHNQCTCACVFPC